MNQHKAEAIRKALKEKSGGSNKRAYRIAKRMYQRLPWTERHKI